MCSVMVRNEDSVDQTLSPVFCECFALFLLHHSIVYAIAYLRCFGANLKVASRVCMCASSALTLQANSPLLF